MTHETVETGGTPAADRAQKRALPYFIGDKYTPSREQIAAARDRHRSWRQDAAVQWRQVLDPADLALVRSTVISATVTARPGIDGAPAGRSPEERENLRVLRHYAADGGAQFFMRNLQRIPGLRMVEMRHEKLRSRSGTQLLGFRFICLGYEHWMQYDFVGLYLDGNREPINLALNNVFNSAVSDPSLIEHYISFAFDHIEFGRDQYYIVRDAGDFILDDTPPAGEPDRRLTAQFYGTAAPQNGPDDARDPIERLLGVPDDLLIPPTLLDLELDDHADIFATVIKDKRLFHIGMTVFKTGRITVDSRNYRCQTPAGQTLPLLAVRSFDEQRTALRNALGTLAGKT